MICPKFVQIAAAGGDEGTYPMIVALDSAGRIWYYFVKDDAGAWIETDRNLIPAAEKYL
jgi:hypothetical protein